jgi:hypothetical protein
MSSAVSRYRRISQMAPGRALAFAIAGLVAVGAMRADSLPQLAAYLLVIAASVLPSVLWVRSGALGIPVFPVVALGHVPYYALPIVSGNENIAPYTSGEVMQAAITVCLYLGAATAAWAAFARRAASRAAFDPGHDDRSNVIRLIFIGLGIGFAFQVALIWGLLAGLGPFFGVARTVALMSCTVACFLAGVARAQLALRGPAFVTTLLGIGANVLLAWSSLLLVGGVIFALAFAFGFVIVRRRIPWVSLLAAIAVVGVLHSGKGEMRAKYWIEDTNYGQSISLFEVPSFLAEWAGNGVDAIVHGEVAANALERASLMQMLLFAQEMTPGAVDYLHGETYALLPAILVPRFIDSTKPASQVGMDLLNVRYGLLTVEGASVTAIGWGLVAEGYANFGYWGVLAMGVLVGLLCGALAWWSADKEVVSVPTLMSIATMMTLINVEVDFIQVVSALLQALAAVIIFLLLYGWLVIRQQRRASLAMLRS